MMNGFVVFLRIVQLTLLRVICNYIRFFPVLLCTSRVLFQRTLVNLLSRIRFYILFEFLKRKRFIVTQPVSPLSFKEIVRSSFPKNTLVSILGFRILLRCKKAFSVMEYVSEAFTTFSVAFIKPKRFMRISVSYSFWIPHSFIFFYNFHTFISKLVSSFENSNMYNKVCFFCTFSIKIFIHIRSYNDVHVIVVSRLFMTKFSLLDRKISNRNLMKVL